MELLHSDENKGIIDKLYIVGGLKAGTTLSLNPMEVVNHNLYTSLYRWYNGESRHQSLAEIRTIIRQTSHLFSLIQTTSEKKRLLLAVFNARDGIETLLETYKGDLTTISTINSILDDIKVLIRQYQPDISAVWRTSRQNNLD